jgi:hypothetical protein
VNGRAALPGHAAAEVTRASRYGALVVGSSPLWAWEGKRQSVNFMAASARRGEVGVGRAMVVRNGVAWSSVGGCCVRGREELGVGKHVADDEEDLGAFYRPGGGRRGGGEESGWWLASGGLKAAIFEVEEGAALGRGTGEATSVLEVEGMRRLVVREEIGDLRRYDLRLSVGGDFWLGLVVGEDQPGGSRPLGT